ncbi:MAG: hypothetical protein VX938_03055, partial [Myxococcota bacterium]|nr:hypothetical protein [Myxococcota bacterium]
LASALRFSTYRLLGHNLEGTGSLAVKANVDTGVIQLEGRDAVDFPLSDPFGQVPTGKIGISMTAEDHFPYFQETYVFGGLQTDVQLALTPLPQAWYQKWYTWAGVGSVVVGAVTTAILASRAAAPGTVTATIEPPKEVQ